MNAAGETDHADPVARVTAALGGLADVDSRPVRDHVAAFERVHQVLTDALSAIDGL